MFPSTLLVSFVTDFVLSQTHLVCTIFDSPVESHLVPGGYKSPASPKSLVGGGVRVHILSSPTQDLWVHRLSVPHRPPDRHVHIRPVRSDDGRLVLEREVFWAVDISQILQEGEHTIVADLLTERTKRSVRTGNKLYFCSKSDTVLKSTNKGS